MSIFAKVPIEVIQDRRLTLEQMRVLLALLSFRNNEGETVWPSRDAIAERTGMHQSNISTATSALAKLGWIEKVGKGGYSKSTRYTIKPAITVAERATVAESATVAEQATPTVAEQATRQVAEQATRKEQTNEQTNEQTKKGRAKRATPIECPHDVDQQVWADWNHLRKAKNAPITNTVIDAARTEAAKASMTFNAFLIEWCNRGSQGLKAEWLTNGKPGSGRRMPQPENLAGKGYGESGPL